MSYLKNFSFPLLFILLNRQSTRPPLTTVLSKTCFLQPSYCVNIGAFNSLTSGNAWVHTELCSYWCPRIKAPGHHYPQCCLSFPCLEPVPSTEMLRLKRTVLRNIVIFWKHVTQACKGLNFKGCPGTHSTRIWYILFPLHINYHLICTVVDDQSHKHTASIKAWLTLEEMSFFQKVISVFSCYLQWL